MKTLIYNIFILLTVTIGISSCSHNPEWERLRYVEAIIDTDHDSALALLNIIDPNLLRSDRDKALYGLLYTQALDRNHQPIPDDSLISASVKYFSNTGDNQHCMIAYNYKGRVHYLNKNYPAAMVAFSHANELAKELDDKFWIGMSARGIADIYDESFNTTEGIIFANEEYENLHLSGRQPYINYSILDLGNIMCSAGKYNNAINLAKQVMDSAAIHHDMYLYNAAIQLIGSSCIAEGKINCGVKAFQNLCNSDYAESSDSIYLALTYASLNEPLKALYLINQISASDSMLLHFTKYKIFKQLRKYDDALYELEQVDSMTNQTFRNHINQNLTGTVVDYLKLSQQATKAELQNAHTHNWLIAIVAMLFIVVTLGVSIHFRAQKHKALNDNIIFAERLQNMLTQTQTEKTKASSVIRELLASKYELLEELCNIIISCSNPRSARQRIAESVTTLIDNLSIRSDKIIAMEHQVDTMYDNLFSDFRKDLPSLKDADYRLYLFTIFGLSNTAISLFLKEDKLTAIYDRKRRLKDRIRQLDPTKCARYMAFFR